MEQQKCKPRHGQKRDYGHPKTYGQTDIQTYGQTDTSQAGQRFTGHLPGFVSPSS
ncbi:GM22883 [Drosophila sechellia]|uniref:GM22883 n=1 Tax=Drosophila sechellia TaxID=7238 RepID=B4I6P3_DROSE|nr:GM22883 [Drosophila sechellia]